MPYYRFSIKRAQFCYMNGSCHSHTSPEFTTDSISPFHTGMYGYFETKDSIFPLFLLKLVFF